MAGVSGVRRKLASCRRRWIDGRGGCSPSLPMEPSLSNDGQLATKPDDDDEAGVDCLSALPNDVLIHIILHLEDAAAIESSPLAGTAYGRFSRSSASLPPRSPAPSPRLSPPMKRPSLTSTWRPPLPPPESVAAWLPTTVRRLSGSLAFTNRVLGTSANDAGEERGAFDIPCLENATTVSLDLDCLGITVPPAGVFVRLTKLSLSHVQLRGPCLLGDAVSSWRCSCSKREDFGSVR
uniref:F-box domain-containing protein n=1 Tax=Setaria viridis TaxID=4556 RepID=A0A4U6WCF5_SETVI|nr:hypothetical protein SEVIR_1G238500v2 [Setaria viridis]